MVRKTDKFDLRSSDGYYARSRPLGERRGRWSRSSCDDVSSIVHQQPCWNHPKVSLACSRRRETDVGDGCGRVHALLERGVVETLERLSGTGPRSFLRTDRE